VQSEQFLHTAGVLCPKIIKFTPTPEVLDRNLSALYTGPRLGVLHAEASNYPLCPSEVAHPLTLGGTSGPQVTPSSLHDPIVVVDFGDH
jgi:hypothetical protein